MPQEITMREMPVRVDGIVTNQFVEEKRFNPESVLEHYFIPLETVQIKEVGNDLVYSTDYWGVERYWRVFLHPHQYDLLMSKFLQGRVVVVNYLNPKNPRPMIPRDKKVDGFSSMFREHTEMLKELSTEELDAMLQAIGYDPIEGTFYASR